MPIHAQQCLFGDLTSHSGHQCQQDPQKAHPGVISRGLGASGIKSENPSKIYIPLEVFPKRTNK